MKFAVHHWLATAALAAAVLGAGSAHAQRQVQCPKKTEVYKCETINGQSYCRCKPRPITAPPGNDIEPRLKGKPQHNVNLGGSATDQGNGNPEPTPRP
ncbi:hypothetical protein ACFOLC_04620 [Lysobacter cavernae]|uniref:Uncharacterized protein n=1 Tax=Lysobacter cavernae TaxID=1685901 RepID=A0ABV7RMC0_9GAMM